MWSGNENGFSLQEPFKTVAGNGAWFPESPSDVLPVEKKAEHDAAAAEPDDTGQTDLFNMQKDAVEKTAPAENAAEWPESIPFSIHVNSFPTKKEAENRIRALSGHGYKCFMVYADVPGKGKYYRIFVGSFSNYSSTRKACDDYRNRKEFADDIHPVTRKWAFTGHRE